MWQQRVSSLAIFTICPRHITVNKKSSRVRRLTIKLNWESSLAKRDLSGIDPHMSPGLHCSFEISPPRALQQTGCIKDVSFRGETSAGYRFRSDCSYSLVPASAGDPPLLPPPPPLFLVPDRRTVEGRYLCPVPVPVTGVRYNSLPWMCTLSTLTRPDLTWGINRIYRLEVWNGECVEILCRHQTVSLQTVT